MTQKPTYEELEQRVEALKRENASLIKEKERAVNITDRDLAVKGLQESEKRYRIILQTARDGFMLIDLDGRILDVNDAYCTMSGYTREELLSMRISDVVTSESPEEMNLRGEKIMDQGGDWFESQHRRKDGSILDVEVSMQLHPEERGCSFSFLRDITERKRAEEEREKLQAQMSNAVEMAHLGPWEYDVANDFFIFNDHFYKIFRTTAEEVGGYTMSSEEYARRFLHPDDIPLVGEEIRKAVEATDPNFSRQLEHRILYANGTVGWITVRFNIIKDENGQTVIAYGANQDITERKRAEEALQDSRSMLQAVLHSIPSGVFWKDRDSNYLGANHAFLEAVGLKSSEHIIGKSDHDLPWEKDQANLSREEDREVMESGIPKHGIIKRYLRADGTRAWVRTNKVPLRDEDGNITGVLGTYEDITELTEAQEASLVSEKKFKSIFENSSDGIVLADTETKKFINSNQRFRDMFGYDIEEIAHLSPNDIHPQKDSSRLIEKVDKQLMSKEVTVNECVPCLRKDGTTFYADISTTISYIEGKKYNIGFFRDITERKRMEEEISKTEKLKSLGVLSGGIAHDFNNILTTILGNISLAKMEVAPKDEIFKLLSDMEKASSRAQALTKQLLTFAKGGAPVKETSSVKDVIKESSIFVLRGSKSSCEFSIAEDLWPVEVDIGQISQVINNVVINANQAMPEGGRIRVAAENLTIEGKHGLPIKPGRYIRISITDQGLGIAKEDMEKVFDPFFTTKPGGSGLGLATTYSIVKNHDGHIAVESELGKGATFQIYLPASKKTVREIAEDRVITGAGRILVMDDEAIVRKTLGKILEKLGYEPEFAEEGAEAIEMYKTAEESGKPYEAVILDLTIPGGMGGKDTIKKLLEIKSGAKAIVSSGYSDDSLLANFQEYGFRGILPKPFNFQAVSKVLNEVIQGKAGP